MAAIHHLLKGIIGLFEGYLVAISSKLRNLFRFYLCIYLSIRIYAKFQFLIQSVILLHVLDI